MFCDLFSIVSLFWVLLCPGIGSAAVSRYRYRNRFRYRHEPVPAGLNRLQQVAARRLTAAGKTQREEEDMRMRSFFSRGYGLVAEAKTGKSERVFIRDFICPR